MCVMRMLLSIMNTWREEGSCRDYNGNAVSDGEWLKPGKDPCLKCKCFRSRLYECVVSRCAADTSGESRKYVPSANSVRCLLFNSSLLVLRLGGQR